MYTQKNKGEEVNVIKEVRRTGKKIQKELDKTIKTVSKKIRMNETTSEYRAETLKALALLVKARAQMK